MIGVKNRHQLSGAVLDEFEYLAGVIRGFFLKEHNEDGTHIIEPPLDNLVPTGALSVWSVATAPSGWYICDGSLKERVADKRLFDVIGTTYGAGDGSTTFNLPDLRGRFVLGKADAGTGSVLAGTGGTLDAAPAISGSTGATAPGTDTQGAHSHGGGTSTDGAHTHTQGAHSHAISSVGAGDESAVVGDLIERASSTQTDIFNDSGTGLSGDHDHTISSDGGHSHTVNSHTHGAGTLAVAASNPPFIALPWIIKS